MSTKGTEWPTAPLSVAVHGNGQRHCFSISSTWKFWTATFSWSLVVPTFHTDFHLTLVRNMVELAGLQPRPLQHVGRPSALVTRIGRLEESSRQHWPTSDKRMNCVVCHARTKKRCRVQTRKMWCWAMYIWLFQRLPRKGAALGNYLWQQLGKGGDTHLQKTSNHRYVIISVTSNVFPTRHHILYLCSELCFLLAWNT
jgi:hypothetical protein